MKSLMISEIFQMHSNVEINFSSYSVELNLLYVCELYVVFELVKNCYYSVGEYLDDDRFLV